MVASPDVNFNGADALANILRDKQRQLDETGRQSTYPFSAGPLGTFQIYPDPAQVDANGKPVVDTVLKYGDGSTALAIKPGLPKFGSKQQMIMNDLAGNVMYRTDESSGYGLSAPLYNYYLGVLYAGTPSGSNTAGTEYVVAECIAQFYNPAIFCKALLTFATGGVTWSARFLITDGNTTVSSSTSSYTGAQYVMKALLLPANFIANQTTKIQLMVTPGTTGSTVVFPGALIGMAKSAYDSNPAMQ